MPFSTTNAIKEGTMRADFPHVRSLHTARLLDDCAPGGRGGASGWGK